MPVQVIVLNGGSSADKTAIARCLQAILPQPWINLSVDDLVDVLPQSLTDSDSGIAFGQHGEVLVGAGFREIEAAWLAGVAAMAASQAETVHQGVVYDIEIDTSHTESLDCARVIAGRVI
jgi:chloramphenicol 3-O phosphotransferase